MGGDHGHNCVSTYAEITITIVHPTRIVMTMMMIVIYSVTAPTWYKLKSTSGCANYYTGVGESVLQSFSLLYITEVGSGRIYTQAEITCVNLTFTVWKYLHTSSFTNTV